MRRRIGVVLLGAVLGAPAALVSGQQPALGRIDFPASGSPAAMPEFLRGVLLLHSFEFPDAAEAFRNAQKADPGFAMAYWGEAMTYNHPLWMERDRDAARKALDRLAATPPERVAKAPTEREKMYVEAVDALYADGDKADRDRAYADAMRRLHERFPDDLDAAAFYGLALLGTCEDKRDVRVYMQAAAIEEEVFAKNPDHPGAAHYLIHCYDDPVHAPLGMRPARVYSKIAPDAVHALHMPSHIFFASGMWEDAVASNIASWDASVERARRKSLSPGEHSFHALSWREYAYLQLGRWRDARADLVLMEADAKGAPTERTEFGLSAMRAAWIVETRRCGGVEPPASAAASRDHFVRGLCALDAGNSKGAEDALAALKGPKAEGESGHAHGGAAAPSYAAGRGGAAVGTVLALELESMIALSRGDHAAAEKLAKEAAAAEDGMSFEFGPPVVVKPAHELSGEVLLAVGKPVDARAEFDVSLSRNPGRSLSLLGLAKAAAAAGDSAVSVDTYARLAAQWSRADADVPGRPEVLAAAKPAR
jgi:tetratricopeptide (TPR) repeat protein